MRELLPYLRLVRGAALRSLLLGLLLASLAVVGAVGLVGLAGWFITISAIVGITGVASFSFAFPSGGVRAFAILRTLTRYGEKLVNHQATLLFLARLRVYFFERALRLPAQR
ncbi:MAG: hypothetical protein JOZ19_03725, partial [Rubrobacter sp.]|nr:hypothetical protein [Rubrobacter sp.]